MNSPSKRSEWLLWVPVKRPAFSPDRRGKSSANFFVVPRGRDVGVKYRWCDVLSSVAGHPDPAFKGYDNLAAAKRAFAALSL